MRQPWHRRYDPGVPFTCAYPDWTLPDLLHRSVSRFPQRTALIFAAETGTPQIVKALLNAGAEVNHKDKRDEAPLFLAIKQGSLPIVRLLLDADADANLTSRQGDAPLMLAADRNNLNVMKALLEKGADVEGRDAQNRTALTRAKLLGQTRAVNLLGSEGAGTTAQFWPY